MILELRSTQTVFSKCRLGKLWRSLEALKKHSGLHPVLRPYIPDENLDIIICKTTRFGVGFVYVVY